MRTTWSIAFSLLLCSGPLSHAQTLDEKLAKLHQEVSANFRANPVPGLPAPQMIAGDLFAIALKSYCGLLQSDSASEVSNLDRFSIVDFNQGPKTARLFVYDVPSRRMVRTTWTSHGAKSDYSLYLRISDTTFSQVGTLNEPITSFDPSLPLFFSNQPESGQSSIGMAVAKPTTYWSDKVWSGVPQGHSVRLVGVDGKLNDQLMSRGVVIHGFDFDPKDFPRFGAPNSLGCVMVDRSISAEVMNEMMGGPVMLYHDRLFPEDNEEAYRSQLEEVARMKSDISRNLRTLGAKYRWSEKAIAANEARLTARLAPLRQKIESVYRYFKNDSRFITFEPKDPEACAKSLGI